MPGCGLEAWLDTTKSTEEENPLKKKQQLQQ